MQKTTEAKTETEKATIIENAQTDILGQITENKGNNISKKQLADILNKQFKTVNENDIPDEVSNEHDIILKTTDDKYTINLSKIYTGAFSEEEIDLSVDTIWQNAFANRYTLNEQEHTITFISGAPITTENVEIKNYAVISGVKYDTKFPNVCTGLFAGCGMKSLSIDSKIDTSNITSLQAMFAGCSNLTSFKAPYFVGNSVNNLSDLFNQCTSLSSLIMTGWDTSEVLNMHGMFNSCKLLSNVDVSMFNTSKVTDMSSMFCECVSLTNLSVPNFDTAKVTNMYWLFSSCTNLNKVIVSDKFITNSVTNSTDMFKNCTSLVGGNGTTYDSSKVDKTYAHIDGGASNPGYFTAK